MTRENPVGLAPLPSAGLGLLSRVVGVWDGVSRSSSLSPSPGEHYLSLLPPVLPPQSLQNPSLTLRRGAVRNPGQRDPQANDHHWIAREPTW